MLTYLCQNNERLCTLFVNIVCCKTRTMSDDLSQGTFELIWGDLFAPQNQNTQSEENITSVTELTNTEFLQEHGFNVEFLFNDMHEMPNPSPENIKGTCPADNPAEATYAILEDPTIMSASTPVLPTPVISAPVVVDAPTNTIIQVNEASLPNTDTAHNQMEISNANSDNPGSEFMHLSTEDVQQMIENEENKNTLKKTLGDVAKFQRFLETKQETRPINEIDHVLLDEYVANYILSVRKANGGEYEPSSIKNMISSIDRKLRRLKYPHKIFSDKSNVFQLSRDALSAKQKSLKRLGKGNKPNKSSPISDQEVNILYEKGVLGGGSAQSLLNTIWFNNCVLFGLRGTKENYDLRWGDVQLKTGSDGIEYLILQERQTKTRTGANLNDVRDVTPKMYAKAYDPERCPVEMFKLYASKRPSDFCKPEHPFYIAPRTKSQKIDNETWFMKTIVGEKKIGGLLKSMAEQGGLDKNKRLTNHSTRKRLVQKLRDAGIAAPDIMQISGHKNVQSVLNYSAMSEEKHKQCSRILSTFRAEPTSTANCPVTFPQSEPASCPVTNVGQASPPSVDETLIAQSDRTNCPISLVQSESLSKPVSTQSSSSSTVNPHLSSSSCTHTAPNPCKLSDFNTNCSQVGAPKPQVSNDNMSVPHPRTVMQELPLTSNSGRNSISFVNDTVNLNTQMNSLFSGAVLNIQNFNVYMK